MPAVFVNLTTSHVTLFVFVSIDKSLKSLSLNGKLLNCASVRVNLTASANPATLLFLADSFALSTTLSTIGVAINAITASIIITASNSIKVNPFFIFYISYLLNNYTIIYLLKQYKTKKIDKLMSISI